MVDAQNASDVLPDGTDATVVAGYPAKLRRFGGAMRSKNIVFCSHHFSGEEPTDYYTYEHSLSIGTISINTTSPEAEPIEDYRTYSDPIDFAVMLAPDHPWTDQR